MSEFEAAIHAARSAGELLLDRFTLPHQESFKGVISIVTEMDWESQRFIFEMLTREFPDYGFLGEEGIPSNQYAEATWIIDPLDGTTNYARGYPLFGVSIALEKNHQVVLGVVYNPLRNELFAAEKKAGATLNGHPIQVTSTAELGKSLLGSGFPYDTWSNQANNCDEWCRFIKKVISVRCDGAASLDLCHVAAGRLDGFWELDLEPWDMAAGALIVEEAGGTVSRTSGASFDPYLRNIVASNGRLHKAMLDVLSLQ